MKFDCIGQDVVYYGSRIHFLSKRLFKAFKSFMIFAEHFNKLENAQNITAYFPMEDIFKKTTT